MKICLSFDFILICVIIICGVPDADAGDCLHDQFPGAQTIYNEAIKSSQSDLNPLDDNAINNPRFQQNCSLFRNPGPPYRCTLDKNKSITLHPEPTLMGVEHQGDFGACYMSAALDNLKYNIEPQKKYSFSDAMCSGNKDRYKSGGVAISALLMIAKTGVLTECSQQKISHQRAILKIKEEQNRCRSDSLTGYQLIAESEKQIWREIKQLHNQCIKTNILPFTINEIAFKNKDDILAEISKVLGKNKKMVLGTLSDHEINIFGVNTYECKNGKKKIIVKTMKILDPNGIKMEVVADDIINEIVSRHELFYLKREDRKIDIKDVYRGLNGLIYAIGTGDVEIVKSYLNADNVNIQTYYGLTPLIMATQKGYIDVVGLLLNTSGIEINKSMNDGSTPLIVSILEGHREIVELLLTTSGIDINKSMNDGTTALYMASQQGNKDIVALLLKMPEIQVNPSLKNEGATPLYIAAQKGYKDIVDLLLKMDSIDVNRSLTNGVTPLMMAAFMGRKDIVVSLLGSSKIIPDLKIEGDTPGSVDTAETIALEQGHLEIAELIRSKIADKNSINYTK